MIGKSFIDDMIEACVLFGPDPITFMSMDDKARVALSLDTATFQVPILIHLDYIIRLPDHSFVVGERYNWYNLIPSVYTVCNILKKGLVTYSRKNFALFIIPILNA